MSKAFTICGERISPEGDLWLSEKPVTTADLSSLVKNDALRRRVKRLFIHRTAISDVHLRMIAQLSNLNCLDISETQIRSLKPLAHLTKLDRLHLEELPIEDRDITHLEGLTRLNCLWLNNTAVSDQALKIVRHLPLETLYLDDTAITSTAAIIIVANFPGLRCLSLNRTQISTSAVNLLCDGLRSLREIYLKGCKGVKKSGRDAFRDRGVKVY